MELAHLQHFRDVARRGSIAAVARAAGRTPSAISRSIAVLEAELGVRLFQRTTRQLALTEAGARYLGRVDPLLDELAAAHEETSGLAGQPRGRLRVTASSAFGQAVIAPMLQGFCSAFPEVTLDLLLTDVLVDLVAEHVDLAVRLGPRPGGDLIVGRLGQAQKRAVASPGYLRAAPAIVEPADLAAHVCLVSAAAQQRSSWLFRRFEIEAVIPVEARIATSNTLTLKRCALDGLGIAVLADWLVDAEIAAGRLVNVLPDWTVATDRSGSGIWVVYPSRSFLPLKARVFIDHLRQHVGGPAG